MTGNLISILISTIFTVRVASGADPILNSLGSSFAVSPVNNVAEPLIDHLKVNILDSNYRPEERNENFRQLQQACSVNDLLPNGDFESGSAQPWSATGLVEGGYGGSVYALISSNRQTWHGPNVNINLDCLKVGDIIAVTGKLRLMVGSNPATCSAHLKNGERCPKAYLKIKDKNGQEQTSAIGYITGWHPDANGWYDITGQFQLPDYLEGYQQAKFAIYDTDGSRDIVIDNFKMYKVPYQCASLNRNPTFDNGDLSFWYPDGNTVSRLKAFSPGASGEPTDFALRSYSRGMNYRGASFFLDKRCLKDGLVYTITAKIKLVDSTGNPQQCVPSVTDPIHKNVCPTVVLKGDNCPDGAEVRLWNEIKLESWNAGGFNEFKATLPTSDKMGQCKEAYLIVGRDVHQSKDVILDDVYVLGGEGAASLREDTLAPTYVPTNVPSTFPSASPTFFPTNKPTPFPTIANAVACPDPSEDPKEMPPGPVMLSRSGPGKVCIIMKAIQDADGRLSAVAPVARSHNGERWTRYGGKFAENLFHGWDFDHHDVGSQITFPELSGDEKYFASSYSYSVEEKNLSEKDAIARFLNTATFGVTAAEIDAFKGPVTKESAADWIKQQMDEPATGHREFLRKRSNARLISQRVQYTPDHPCDPGSRWRSYTFSRNDGYNYWNKLKIGLEGKGPYVITLGGHARTTVAEFPWAREKHPVFDQSKAYDFCDRPEEWINGTVKMRVKTCESFKNPPIYFDTTVTDLPNPVVPLPAIGNGLEVIDTHRKSNGQEFILANGLDDDVCSKLPGVHDENQPPMFGQLPDGTWLQFDPHFDVMENTVDNPLSDGGGIKTFLTDGYTQCSNAARSLFNEHGCKLSSEPTTCQGSYSRSEIKIDLNTDSIIAMHNITGKYIYAVTNIPLKGDSEIPIISACREGVRSRWEVLPSNECTPTTLDAETLEALTAVLQKSPDTNAFIRDITFPKYVHHCSAESKESLEEVSIIIESQCFKRVHPEHMSIFDMSYCAKDDNPCLLDTAKGHPIKDPMDNDESVFLDYSGQSNKFFDESISTFTKVGRFGDTILFRDLGYGLTSDDIAIYFGNSDSVPNSKILVCGSQDEVANDPSLGHHFDITTGQDNHYRKIVSGRESIWAMLALSAKDQLRQRMAWALAQLLVVVPSQVNSSGSTHAEAFLHFYDTFVRHAFGNYGDILREVTYSPLMGENLSYGGSRSGGYNFEKEGVYTFADENYAREIMQLFSVGLNLLNEDGTEKRDENGDPIPTYTNDEVMSFARVFTGFDRVPPRGNSEEIWFGRNVMDPMTIEAAYRDKFPKHDLTGGYIGDGYPLCSDLPPKMFLRKGAIYKLLGGNPAPREYEDSKDLLADPTMKLFVLQADSALRKKLCNSAGGQCNYDPVVTLDSNLDCSGEECLVDEPRAVQVGDIFYEYVRPPCVEQVFYPNPLRVTYVNQYHHSLCANPKLPVASEACLKDPKKPTKVCLRYSKYVFDQERVTYATAQARCEEDGLQTSWFHFIEGIENQKKGFHWTNSPCEIKVKVNSDGLVSIVYDIPGVTVHSNANMESRNFFKVYWNNGIYPKNDLDGEDGNSCGSGACTPLEEGGCFCKTSAFEGKVFKEMPSRSEDVLSKLYIGAYDPSTFDGGTYTVEEGNGVKAYLVGNEYSSNTVFEVTDAHGRTQFLKNSKEFVRIDGSGFSFRSAPSFMSILNEEASLRDARYEVDAVIDHLLYHPNTAPFIAIRLIQRFVTSNPTPDYVKTVATAFKTGKYDGFGSGKYGDLAATISAVLLEPDALSVVLDVDPFHGSIREPLLKAIAFMRSMELELIPEKKVLELAYPFRNKLGQMAHSFDTVFSFFLPENIPTGKPGAASLYSPEAMLVDMPKVTGLLNGLYSTIKNGISNCYNGFGDGWSIPCEEGDFSHAVAMLSFDRSSEDADAVVSELSTLLTSGRISPNNKQLIIDAYTSKLPDKAAALRIAQQLIVSTPEFHSFDTVKSTGEARETVSSPPPSGVPYKAVIFLMLQGGADSFNMLVPHTCSPKDMYSEYKKVRGAVSLPLSSLLEIDASSSNQVCTSFGMHPKLVTAKQLYDDGDLLWFANAGVLTRPTNKEKYKSDAEAALFAHNSMQREIQRIDPFKTNVETGVLGRIADALQSEQKLSVEKYNLYKGSYSLDGHYGSEPFIVDGNGVPKFNEAPSDEGMDGVIRSLNGATEFDSGVFADLFSNLFVNSIDANRKLTDALDQTSNTTATFGTDTMGTAFNMVARLIATRELRGVDRDFFFVPHSNWDAHNQLEWNLNTNLAELDNAINAFSTEMKTVGLWESTTIIQASDFGRSLEPNGGGGTDHAWGGNYMMMGGAVSGGKIVGKYPDTLTDDGPEIIERGRIIPTLSWDEIIAPIAEWMGVTPESVKDVCPNIDNFPESRRLKLSEMFDTIA